MITLEMKSYYTISTEKQQKYQQHHKVKLTNVNIFQAKKYYLFIFTYSALQKTFGKTNKND